MSIGIWCNTFMMSVTPILKKCMTVRGSEMETGKRDCSAIYWWRSEHPWSWWCVVSVWFTEGFLKNDTIMNTCIRQQVGPPEVISSLCLMCFQFHWLELKVPFYVKRWSCCLNSEIKSKTAAALMFLKVSFITVFLDC